MNVQTLMTVSEKNPIPIAETEDEVVTCPVHPNQEATLRCNRCGRPMCTKCAVRTPVGYRCRECVRQQQDKFFDAQTFDYIIAGLVSVVVSFVAAFILARFGFRFGFFMIFIAFFVSSATGGAIGTIVRALTKKRRGRYTGLVVAAGVILGALPSLLFNPLMIAIFMFLATGTAAAQFGTRLTINR